MSMNDFSGYHDPGSYQQPKQPMGYGKFHPYDAYSGDVNYSQVPVMSHMGYQQQSRMAPMMNSDPNMYIPRQMQRQDAGGFNPLGYGTRRPQPVQQQSQQHNQILYNQQQYQRSDPSSYASAASQYISQPQPISVSTHMNTVQQQQPHQQESKADLMALKMTLSEEKKQKESDQEAYASRFLQAVQERVNEANLSQQNGVSNGVSYESNGYYDQSLEMYEFEAQHQSNQQYHVSADLLQRMEQMSNKMVIFEVQIGLEQLMSEPNEYDTWAVAVRDRLMAKDGNQENLEVASWMIIEMAMNTKDTQSLLARLSAYLIDFVNGFSDHFTHNLDYFVHDPSSYSVEVLQNFVIFTAEVYERALMPNRSRNVHYAVMVIDLMRNLRDRQVTDSTVKTLVDALKLCGYHLQIDSYKEAVNDIVKYLESLVTNPNKPKTLTDAGCSCITTLMTTYNQWGKETPNDVANARYPSIQPINNPMDLTDEEIGFLEKHGAMEHIPTYGYSATDFDDEILDDYEKFLRDNEHTAISTAEKILEKLSIDEDDCPPEDFRKDDNKTPTPSRTC